MLSTVPIADAKITEDQFSQMVIKYREEYFRNIDFKEKLALHREPDIYLNEKLQELYKKLDKLGNSEVMRDIDGTTYGYVQPKIIDIWKADRRLKSLYDAIVTYCESRGKEIIPIAIAIAEYRALYRVRSLILRKQNKLRKLQEMKVTPKHFELEVRKVMDNIYLKVHLKKAGSYEDVATHLEKLDSVRRANVTAQQSGKTDITVYPAKAYDITETQAEVEASLKVYFSKNPNDPVFKAEPISSISDKAYEEIIDHILRLGKNLESQQIDLDEEGYRNQFVSHLNALSEKYASKGESFNREGKTDILIFDNEGNNTFIAECKLWKGKRYLIDAIDQLLERYVNWRDEKTAIIIFNKDRQTFTDLIATAVATMSSHPLCEKSLGQRKDTAYSFLFRNPKDAKKIIKLELILFNFV
jgi:hypothetical protein